MNKVAESLEHELPTACRHELLRLARRSIAAAMHDGQPASYPNPPLPRELTALQSSFVTLRLARELRGCCGTLDAARPLAEDVWRNGWAAAFADSRFDSLTADELPSVTIHISVLSPPEQLLVEDETDLLRQLRPGIDGLVLALGSARATFLPAVWQQVEDAARFVRQLKAKAGWRADFWSPDIRASRYTADSFGEDAKS
jgi:uncharacterized protein